MEPKDLAKTAQQPSEKSRRDFLKSAGKIAICTPPAIMLLMKPGKQALACSGSLRGNRLVKKERGSNFSGSSGPPEKKFRRPPKTEIGRPFKKRKGQIPS